MHDKISSVFLLNYDCDAASNPASLILRGMNLKKDPVTGKRPR